MRSSFFLILVFSLAPAIRCEIFSAVKKSHGFKVSDEVLDMVDIVQGYHYSPVAFVNFSNTINETGWAFLELIDSRVDDTFLDVQLAQIAGYLEGQFTAPLIEMHWRNTFSGYCDDKKDFCTKLYSFLTKNEAYCSKKFADLNKAENYQAYLWYTQLQGTVRGYNAVTNLTLNYTDFMLMQLFGDLEDLESALGGNSSNITHVTGSGSCSALIKLLPQNEELYVSHDTWGDYNTMLRIFKRYDFRYSFSAINDTVIPGNNQIFSSYPGILHSGDDFYLISSGLVTMETTIGNNNPDLWQYITPENLFEPVRVVVANRLAATGQEWSAYFSEENMGTYNNQWMVVDYKRFVPGNRDLIDGLLWIVEQIPGMIKSGDQTDMLRKTSYWPSFNIAYFPEIYNASGTGDLAKKYGEWFTWSGSPRAKIFSRDNMNVADLRSMIALMRYNNFQHDELSQCSCSPPYSAENSIAARSDLNPPTGTYAFSALGHRRHGATDMKVTSHGLFQTTSCVAVSGPTCDQQPVFEWSTSGFEPTPVGHPDRWNFKPVIVKLIG